MPGVETRQLAGGGIRHAVRVRDPNPKPGKHGYTSATFATRPEAERFVRDCDDRGIAWALAEYHRAKDASDEPNLDEWAATHFGALTEANADTIDRYRRIYAASWSPLLGHMRLSQITRVDVAQALNKVPGANKTKKNAWGVLTHMLKLAAQDGLIARSPTVGVSPPKYRGVTEEHRYLTLAEFWAILEATPEHWRPLVLMLGGTGIRWGELAALEVGDIDPEAAVVRIIKAEKRDPETGGVRIAETKTGKSRRTVALPSDVLDAVLPLTEGRKRNARLFLPPNGGPLRHRTFYRDIWLKKCCAGSGVREPYPRLHDLRHSHVAWLIAEGVSLPVIQARLGHEKITTTIDTYGHLLPDVQRAAADAADRVFAARPRVLAPPPQGLGGGGTD